MGFGFFPYAQGGLNPIIYDQGGQQLIRLAHASDITTLDGAETSGDSLSLKGSSADALPRVYIHGANGIMFNIPVDKVVHCREGDVDFLTFKASASGAEGNIYGPDSTGDDLILHPNYTDAYPKLKLNGLGYVNIYHNTDKGIYFYEELTNYLRFYDLSGIGATIESGANKDIYLKPGAGGYVRFGAETTNAGSDRGKLVPFNLADGTTVYIKTYDTV